MGNKDATRATRLAAQGPHGFRVLGYLRTQQNHSGLECTVPGWIDLPKRIYQEERAVVLPGRKLRDKQGLITVMWRDAVVYRGKLSRCIELAVPSASTLSYARRAMRAQLVAIIAGGGALVILAIVTVSILNTLVRT